MGVQVRPCGAVSYCDSTAEAQRGVLSRSADLLRARPENADAEQDEQTRRNRIK